MFVIFKKWKAEVENKIDLNIKCMRSNSGRKYDKLELAFCVVQGIKLMRVIPGKTRQNDIVERMKRTLNEWTRSMGIHYGLALRNDPLYE